MSTTVKAGWLKDSQGNKFAPKTLSSQVITNDGLILEEKIVADLNTLETSVKGYTDTKVADLVGAAPELLDTFEEVATAIKENQDVADALQSAIGNKVDKEEGKGLSSNDFTDEEKEKLASLSENGSLTDEEKALLASIENKVDIAQGAENAGMILAVDDEGNVSLNAAPEVMDIVYDEIEQILEFVNKPPLPKNIRVDSSLSTSGDAADAKVVGDRLKTLEEMLENGVGILEETQADWNVNDETSAAYVKNRPFYTKDPVNTVFIEETSLEISEDCEEIPTLLKLDVGEEYTVIVNGTVYECTAWYSVNEEAIMLGNGNIYGGTDSATGKVGGNGEPFSIDSYDDGECYLNVSVPGTYTISISGIISEVIILEEKYIPYIAGRNVEGKTFNVKKYDEENGEYLEEHVAGVGAEIFNDYRYNVNVATGNYSHAEGGYIQAIGDYSHAEGYQTTASGYAAHSEGYNTEATEFYSHAEGSQTKASGGSSHAEGDQTTASGNASHAEGVETKAIGNYSHAEGYNTKATGNDSHAEGGGTTASGVNSHAEGGGTTASGAAAHAEGYQTTASRDYSHAEGYSTTASGGTSHAEGSNTIASGFVSHVEGWNTTASGDYQHVQGKWNIEDTENRYAHIVGNGFHGTKLDEETGEYVPGNSNAHTLDWDGNAWFAGDVFVGGTSQDDAVAKKLATKEEVDELKAMLETYIARVAALVGGDA